MRFGHIYILSRSLETNYKTEGTCYIETSRDNRMECTLELIGKEGMNPG